MALLIYVTLTYMLMDTLQSLIYVPYLALTPELASDYDERTSLTGFRSFFQLFGSWSLCSPPPTSLTVCWRPGYTAAGIYACRRDLWRHQHHPPAPDRHLRPGKGNSPTDRGPVLARDPAHDVAQQAVPLRCGDPPSNWSRRIWWRSCSPSSCCTGWPGETSLPPSVCWDLTSPTNWRSSVS